MPDPVSTLEVEDVLASIRRLVSGKKDSIAPIKPVMPDERLILTPELRVVDEPDFAALDATIKAKLAAKPVETGLEETDSHVSSRPPQTQQNHPKDDDARVVVSNEPINAESIVHAMDPTQEPVQASSAFKAALNVDDDAIVDLDEDVGSSTPLEEHSHAPEVQSAPEASKPGLGAYFTEDIRAKIAALEATIDKNNTQWEPDNAKDNDDSETQAPPLVWEDVKDHDSTSNAKPSIDEVEAPNEDVIDEQALRDIVSAVVREELQGALGERITRNVRKLVRREIHRALTERNL